MLLFRDFGLVLIAFVRQQEKQIPDGELLCKENLPTYEPLGTDRGVVALMPLRKVILSYRPKKYYFLETLERTDGS